MADVLKHKFNCKYCHGYFYSNRNLRKHVMFAHPGEEVPPLIRRGKLGDGPLLIRCQFCPLMFGSRTGFLDHRNRTHLKGKIVKNARGEKNFKFNSMTEFLAWKTAEEESSTTQYTTRRSDVKYSNGDCRRVYYCRGDETRRTAARGSKVAELRKAGLECSSSMVLRIKPTGHVEVTYYPMHKGHGQHRPSLEQRARIAEMLAAGTSLEEILESINSQHSSPTRCISRKYLENFSKNARACNIRSSLRGDAPVRRRGGRRPKREGEESVHKGQEEVLLGSNQTVDDTELCTGQDVSDSRDTGSQLKKPRLQPIVASVFPPESTISDGKANGLNFAPITFGIRLLQPQACSSGMIMERQGCSSGMVVKHQGILKCNDSSDDIRRRIISNVEKYFGRIRSVLETCSEDKAKQIYEQLSSVHASFMSETEEQSLTPPSTALSQGLVAGSSQQLPHFTTLVNVSGGVFPVQNLETFLMPQTLPYENSAANIAVPLPFMEIKSVKQTVQPTVPVSDVSRIIVAHRVPTAESSKSVSQLGHDVNGLHTNQSLEQLQQLSNINYNAGVEIQGRNYDFSLNGDKFKSKGGNEGPREHQGVDTPLTDQGACGGRQKVLEGHIPPGGYTSIQVNNGIKLPELVNQLQGTTEESRKSRVQYLLQPDGSVVEIFPLT